MSDIARADWEEEQRRLASFPTFGERFAPVVPQLPQTYASAGQPYMDQFRFNDDPNQTWRAYDKAASQQDAYNKLPTIPGKPVGPAWLHATPSGQEAPSLPQQIESDKALASMFVPTSIPEAGLMLATGGTGKALGKLGASVLGAGGIYGMTTDEAQAGMLGNAGKILRGAAAKEAWLGPDIEAKLASAKHPYSSVVGTPIRDMPAPSYRETVAFDRPAINFEQLKGGAFIPAPGDASIAGKQILGAAGQKFEHPVETYGGPDFARMMQTIGAPVPNNPNAFPVWQSMQAPMGAVANIARQVEAKGMQPWLLYTTGAKKYLDQSMQMVDTSLEGAKAAGLTQKQIDHVNKIMRDTDTFSVDAIKDFPSLELLKKGEDGALTFYNKLLDYPMPARAKLVKSMDSAEARSLGFPDMGALRVANTVPELLTTPSGGMGFTISKLDPSVGSFKSPYHPTYNTGVGGTEVYTLPGGVSVPPSEIVPRMHQARQDVGGVFSKMYAAQPHKFYPAGPKGTDSSYEPITNEVLDRLQNYLRINPRGAAAIGGTVAGAAALTSPDQAEAAKLPQLGGVVRGAARPAAMGVENWTPIKAYHSSPHDFERFDLSKIGTGEGAQVYGHGLYFAENPAVSGQGGQYWNQFKNRFAYSPAEMEAVGVLQNHNFDRARAIAELEDSKKYDAGYIGGATNSFDRAKREAIVAKNHEALDLLKSGKPIGPRTYEVNIHARPEQMLDWDKPLTQQSDVVRETAARLGIPDKPHVKGEQAYFHLGGDALLAGKPSKTYASEQLREAGIPGIRYLDEGSRNLRPAAEVNNDIERVTKLLQEPGKEPWRLDALRSRLDLLKAEREKMATSNYVIFDPGIIEIAKKYGIPGMLGAGALGETVRQDRYNSGGT